MESAVGMQLRSKASPADSIIQSATLHRTEWAVPNAVSRDAGEPRWDGRRAGSRSVQTSLSPRQESLTFWGLWSLLAPCQTARIVHDQIQARTIKSSVSSKTYNFGMVFNGLGNIKLSLQPCPHSDTDMSIFQTPQQLCTRLSPTFLTSSK